MAEVLPRRLVVHKSVPNHVYTVIAAVCRHISLFIILIQMNFFQHARIIMMISVYWGRNEMAVFLRTTFAMFLLYGNKTSIGSDNMNRLKSIIWTKGGLIHKCTDMPHLLIIKQDVHLNCFRADDCVVITTVYHFPTCLLKHVIVPIQCNCD